MEEHAITGELTTADEAHLTQEHDFAEWRAVLYKLNPLQLAAMAERALKTNASARHSLDFWNAVINGLVLSSHMAINMTDERRVAGLRMAEAYKDVVRGVAKHDASLMMQVEAAWAASEARAVKFAHPDVRLRLFKMGAITEWGLDPSP